MSDVQVAELSEAVKKNRGWFIALGVALIILGIICIAYITAVLNGKQTAKIHNGMWVEGPFTLQYGKGVMKFRKVAIKPL